KTGYASQLAVLDGQGFDKAAAYRKTMLGMEYGVVEEPGEGKVPAYMVADLEGRHPPADGAGHRIRGERAARRHGIHPFDPIKIDGDAAASRSAGLDADGRRSRPRDEPETIAADAVHMRVNHRDRRGGGHHGLDGVSALAQHRNSDLRRQMMRRAHHSTQ